MCTFLWSVLVGYNWRNPGRQLKTQPSGQTPCSWIIFPWLLYWGMEMVSSRWWRTICWKGGRIFQPYSVAANCPFTFCFWDRSDEMRQEKLQTEKRIRKWVPKHITKRSQRFSIVCYYQTQQRCRCSNAPTRGEKSITETLTTACRAKSAISMYVGGTRLI